MKYAKKLLFTLSVSAIACVICTSNVTTNATYAASSIEYSEVSSITEVESHEINDEGQDVISEKTIYTRDNDGKILYYTEYKYEEDGTFSPNIKTEYTYDKAGHITVEQDYDYDNDSSSWVASWANEDIYDDNGNITKSGTFRILESGDKKYRGYSLFEYNSNNLLAKESIYSLSNLFDPESEVVLSLYYTYEYNASNQLAKLEKHVDLGDQDFYVSNITTYKYDNAGNRAEEDSTSYESNGDFYCCYYVTYEYDNQNRVTKDTEFVYESADHQDLYSVSMNKYTYDGATVERMNYCGYSFEGGYDEALLTKNEQEIETDSDDEYKYLGYSYFDGETPTFMSGKHVVREFEDGYLTKVSTYYIDETLAETLEFYDVITTNRTQKVEKKGSLLWLIPVCSVVVLIGAYLSGYFFFYAKGKAQGKFFDAIYTWFKNFLAKLNKNKNKAK